MLHQIFSVIEFIEDNLWVFIGFPAIMILGLYLSFKNSFVQIRKFPYVVKSFGRMLFASNQKQQGLHPIRAFFASVGGCLGIGNVIGICTAVQIGGPGALFWIWVTGIAAMILKYCEVYLGVRFRESNGKGGYNGGPMFYLKRVFKSKWIPSFVCVLLCIYGVEILQFNVVINTVSSNFPINKYLFTFILLGLVIFAGSGGVRRVGMISSAIIPFFVIAYMGMGFWVLYQNAALIPEVLQTVFKSAFSGHAAVGGFAGSGLILMISMGIRRGAYSSDAGVGFASVIHSESSTRSPEKQALLAIFDVFLDLFMVCSMSVILVLITGVWKEPIDQLLLVQTALGMHFPYMQYFMPVFIFLLGYNTINAYFCVGMKCAEHLSPRRGRVLFYLYAIVSLLLFSFVDTTQAMTIMSLTQVLLLIINLYGIYRLRNEIDFNFAKEEASEGVLATAEA